MPSLRPVCAILSSSQSADSTRTFVVVSEQPVASPPMMPAERFDAFFVGNHTNRLVERVGLAVERQQLLSVSCAPHRQIAMHLVGIEHVQRPAAVEGDEIGDVDKRVDWTQPDCGQPLLQPVGRRTVLDAAHQAQAEGRAQRRRLAELERDFHRAREGALHRFWNLVFICADRSCAEVARNT